MIIWVNGAFGSGKTTVAEALTGRLRGSMLYDPEMVGFFLGHVVGPSPTGDFQDLPIWRTMVGDLAVALTRHHSETLVVPMTVVEPRYFDEILETIENAAVAVHRFVLDVDEATLRHRISGQVMNPDDPDDDRRIRRWRLDQIDRCLRAFAEHDLGTPIPDDGRPVGDVVDDILGRLP